MKNFLIFCILCLFAVSPSFGQSVITFEADSAMKASCKPEKGVAMQLEGEVAVVLQDEVKLKGRFAENGEWFTLKHKGTTYRFEKTCKQLQQVIYGSHYGMVFVDVFNMTATANIAREQGR